MYRRLSVLQQLSSEKRCRKRSFINVLQYLILTSFFDFDLLFRNGERIWMHISIADMIYGGGETEAFKGTVP
jgi:hypothetical protein